MALYAAQHNDCISAWVYAASSAPSSWLGFGLAGQRQESDGWTKGYVCTLLVAPAITSKRQSTSHMSTQAPLALAVNHLYSLLRLRAHHTGPEGVCMC